MVDSLPDPTTAPRPGTPRWVKAIGLVVFAVILIALVVMAVGGGQHGPGTHTGVGEPGHDEAGIRGQITVG